jgi:hypothetical protein
MPELKPGWVAWYRQRSGDDGRRPSGRVLTRTSRQHYYIGDFKTACGLEVNLYTHAGNREIDGVILPKCGRCVKKMEGR